MITRVKFKDKNSQERFLRILKGLYENYKKEDHSQANFGARPGSKQKQARGVHDADEDKNQGGKEVTTIQTKKENDKEDKPNLPMSAPQERDEDQENHGNSLSP